MDLTQLLRSDWLGLNAAARRNALVAAAHAVRRAEERSEAERALVEATRPQLRRAQ
ncbi:MAG: hypothetical protein JWN77_2814 [Frankiales bacterium]|jgi:hypothetical protein|nr:hypothetical protein [Frankiales bacterium]